VLTMELWNDEKGQSLFVISEFPREDAYLFHIAHMNKHYRNSGHGPRGKEARARPGRRAAARLHARQRHVRHDRQPCEKRARRGSGRARAGGLACPLPAASRVSAAAEAQGGVPCAQLRAVAFARGLSVPARGQAVHANGAAPRGAQDRREGERGVKMGKHFKQPVSDAGSDAAGSDATELLDGAADVTRRMSGAEGARQTAGADAQRTQLLSDAGAGNAQDASDAAADVTERMPYAVPEVPEVEAHGASAGDTAEAAPLGDLSDGKKRGFSAPLVALVVALALALVGFVVWAVAGLGADKSEQTPVASSASADGSGDASSKKTDATAPGAQGGEESADEDSASSAPDASSDGGDSDDSSDQGPSEKKLAAPVIAPSGVDNDVSVDDSGSDAASDGASNGGGSASQGSGGASFQDKDANKNDAQNGASGQGTGSAAPDNDVVVE